MAEKQPDYKKSKNDPYDLNTVTPTVPMVRQPAMPPDPYDLVEGASVRPTKEEDD